MTNNLMGNCGNFFNLGPMFINVGVFLNWSSSSAAGQ